MEQPVVLAIGGWDPSGGAGLAADIKTFEMHRVTGMGVVSALTFQTESEFYGLKWISVNDIIKQIQAIVSKYSVKCIKIGMIENGLVVREIINYIHSVESFENIPIVWDPVLSASAGYNFRVDMESIRTVLNRVTLLTPNLNEFYSIFGDETRMAEFNQEIKSNNWGAVLIKGGHASGHANDLLLDGHTSKTFDGQKFENRSKHGSGCVLSSAIAANLAKGASLTQACKVGKQYTESFLNSSETLLGNHLVCVDNLLETSNLI